MKRLLSLLLLLIPSLLGKAQDEPYQWPKEPEVLAKLQAWQDLKFGIILHWGVYSVPGMVESWQITSEDWITPDTTRTYEEEKLWYWGLSREFNPTQFDPTQWARVSREAGMKYVVFTTKHHDGFCLFDTRTTDYKVTNSGFKGNPKADVLRYVMDAYRAEGLMAGMYFSKPDWHCPYYWWPAKATPTRHHNYNIKDYPDRWENYKQYVYDQVDELMRCYGPVDILWLDGGWCTPPREDIDLPRIVRNARRLQPGIIVVDRTCGGEFENYQTPEQTIPDHQILTPWESCITLTQDWGWNDHPQYKSIDRVLAILAEIVAKGGSLLLGVGPTPQGLIEDSSVERLQEIGRWLNANGEAIYSTVPTPIYTNEAKNVWFTANKDGKTLYAIIPKDDEKGIPATITWQGNKPRKGSRIINLATGRPVRYTIKDDVVIVTLPKDASSSHGVALKITRDEQSVTGEGWRWVGTWASAPQETPEQFMPQTELSGASVRQTVRASIGGEQLRLRLSNRYADEALHIQSVYIAEALDSCLIDTSTACYLTFNGQQSVSIKPGEDIYSDVAHFQLQPLGRLSITINYEESPQKITCHNGSFSTSYVKKGASTPETDFSKSERINHWYNITAIDVWRPDASAIAILGNSITDGHGATMNGFTTWPDVLASGLKGNDTGVLNLGIGANCVTLERGLGEPAVKRFDHDILGQHGLKAIVVFQGVNDIGAMKGDTTQCQPTIDRLIAAYREFIDKAHNRGLFVYGATITPFYHSKYFQPGHEQVRQAINHFIRESGAFDAVIDFDKAVRNPADTLSLLPKYQCGDWLHPNDAGYKAMGEAAMVPISQPKE